MPKKHSPFVITYIITPLKVITKSSQEREFKGRPSGEAVHSLVVWEEAGSTHAAISGVQRNRYAQVSGIACS